MRDLVPLDHIAFSTLRAHRVVAVVAVLVISFGAKVFSSSPPVAEANTHAVRSASLNVLQMHRDATGCCRAWARTRPLFAIVDTKSLPVQK